MVRDKTGLSIGGFSIGLCIVVFYPLTEVPVVPVAHWGTHRVYDHYRRRFRPLPRTEVIVRAGPPVDLSDLRRRPVEGPLLREATDRVMIGVRTLLAEVRQEPAPTEFFDPQHPGGRPGRSGERQS